MTSLTPLSDGTSTRVLCPGYTGGLSFILNFTASLASFFYSNLIVYTCVSDVCGVIFNNCVFSLSLFCVIYSSNADISLTA